MFEINETVKSLIKFQEKRLSTFTVTIKNLGQSGPNTDLNIRMNIDQSNVQIV